MGANLSAIKNLGRYVSRQIVQTLADHVYPADVEADLLTLRQLFQDFDDGLTSLERQRRLAGAQVILERLSGTGARREAQDTREKDQSLAPPPELGAYDLWNVPIQFAKGVGPKKATLLARLGIHTVEDALWFLPWRYEDRSIVTPIARVAPGGAATICGHVVSSTLRRTTHRRMTVLDVAIEDKTGAMHAVFFNQPYLQQILQVGARAMFSGHVSAGRGGWTDLRMESPQYDILGAEDEAPVHVGRIVPIYHETKGLNSRQIRVLLKGLLDQYARGIPDLLPRAICEKYRLPTIRTAFFAVHFPPRGIDFRTLERGTTPAHARLAFEELFVFELALAMRQRSVKKEAKGIRFQIKTPLLAQLRGLLPFRPTPAQERVLVEIQRDMATGRPMNRLIQGDVGCGKTIVALQAMVIACGSGYQAALMVPTEILAEQHYLNMRDLCGKLGLKTVLLRGGGSVAQRKAALLQIRTGEAHIMIGTHAMIQKGVEFANLGLAVIDEQHKFGVLQRKTLLEKGIRPDVLVLTATPIPRTLAMTVYGDLDISVIDALPPGRAPIRTWLFHESQRRRAYRLVDDEVKAGRQAYIVYPLVEESEKLDLQAAMQAAEYLQTDVFPGYRVGLLHGRMKAADKERTMAAFTSREIQILVTTTVIEVGVDVSNATVMVIEHAERFGLAQLHQLRGRVGRGRQQSYCLLLTQEGGVGIRDRGVEPPFTTSAIPLHRYPSTPSSQSRRRLEALVKSTDGFVIAEEDLRIRGPGEFFGVRQWGVPEFRAANIIRDASLLEHARREAFALLHGDPLLAAPGHRPLREALFRKWKAKLDLGSVS
ncbi:MAG TPA: ATP-dependent DNA helicase RecG [Nitrospiraceae bacterium]|nr:ATP-dependent DNA helicase RecG [Nitrospiraceae bacterium]